MKHKTSELSGALLDAAVAKALGLSHEIRPQKVWVDGLGNTIINQTPVCWTGFAYYEPSTDRRAGGEIIERKRIVTAWAGSDTWLAGMSSDKGVDSGGDVCLRSVWFSGPTPLIAGMRAFVADELGNEVEL